VSILDLTIKSIRTIEQGVGAKMTDWPDGVSSVADLYARIYAEGTGTPLEEVEALTLRELTDLVVLGEDAAVDPT
jgi:ATP-dependent protease ClpP protease subunit